MPKTYIHVNNRNIRANRSYGKAVKPVLTAKHGKHGSSHYAKRVDILDKLGNVVGSVVYDMEHPLSCGAVAYVECLYPPNLVEESDINGVPIVEGTPRTGRKARKSPGSYPGICLPSER